jgi:hypothetical protein
MKQLCAVISVFLILLVLVISISTFGANVSFSIFSFNMDLPVGSLASLISAFSFLSALSLLIALGLTDTEEPMSPVQKKNKLEEDKIRKEIESDRVKYLEAKIKTLESAIKKIDK